MQKRVQGFKIPIGLDKESNNPVNVKDALNGLKCNCICPICKEDIVAYNNEGIKVRAHFKHRKEAECSINGESYIHWLAKEAFKDMEKNGDEFTLPPFEISTFDTEIRKSFKDRLGEELKKVVVEKPLPLNKFFPPNKLKLVHQSSIKVCKVNTEVFKKTDIGDGDVRVDITIEHEGKELFIEPFLTSEIDYEKYRKLLDLDTTTIAINLNSFIIDNDDWDFTLDDMKYFLQSNVAAKEYVVLKKERYDNLFQKSLDNYFNEQFLLNLDEASKLRMNVLDVDKELNILRKEVTEIHNRIFALENAGVKLKFKEVCQKINYFNDSFMPY